MSPLFPELSTPCKRGVPLPVSLISCAFMLSLTGCAGQKTTHTGFIPDENYTQMIHPKNHVDDLVFVAPDLDVTKYRFVTVEPVIWHPSAKAPRLSPEVQSRMTQAFHDELVKTLSRDFQIVPPDACGPCTHVIRVRGAITNIRRSKWYYNALPIVAGFAAGAAGGGLPPIPPPAPGGASEEVVATDATTNKTLVAIATYNNGMPWNMVGQWLPYAHAKRAFHLASTLLNEELRKTRTTEASHTFVAKPA